jgi:hypothetical protein
MSDEILQEIRKTRDAFAERHNFDIRAMVAELQQLDQQSDRPVVRHEPRRPRTDSAPIVGVPAIHSADHR